MTNHILGVCMKNLKSFGLLVAVFATTLAFAKITVYSDEQILSYVLGSPELAALKAPGQQLQGLKLYNSKVVKHGTGGLGTVYDVQLSYRAGGYSLTVCGVTARVVNKKDPKAPHGITASILTRPKMSKVQCAY